MEITSLVKNMEIDARRVRDSVSFSGTDDFPDTAYRDQYTDGFSKRLGQRKDATYMRKLAEAARIVEGVRNGTMPDWYLKEAMTTSDFPLLFGDNLYRMLLGNYIPYPTTYQNYTKIIEVKDFRKVNLFTIDGGTGALPLVTERSEYPETKFVEGRYQIQVAKYGERFSLSFEMLVNDDLSAFTDRIKYLGQGARFSEELLATQQFVDANGPHASFYTTGNKNRVHSENFGTANNPPLSINALQQAFAIIASQKNADGQPIMLTTVELVVPPALMVTAENILNGTELWLNEAGGNTNSQLHTVNWMRNRLRLSVNPFIPSVASTANGNTSWFLFANPDNNQRPAIVMAFLQGRRNPQMYIRDPNQRMVGGGATDPMEGNFETDSIDYKIRHFLGGSRVDPKMTVASSGAGS